jgi:hypothetical protein
MPESFNEEYSSDENSQTNNKKEEGKNPQSNLRTKW